MQLSPEHVSALVELERQIVNTGTCEVETARKATAPFELRRMNVLRRYRLAVERNHANPLRRGIYGRRILAIAYDLGLIPHRHLPVVDLPGRVTDDGVCIITDPCPYCGKRHTHGAACWGTRVPHCLNLPNCYGQYRLVEKVTR